MNSRLLILLLSLFLLSCSTAGTKSTVSSDKGKGELNEREQMKLKSLFIDAQKERMLGNLNTSRGLLKQCLDIDPDNHAVHYDMAILARMEGYQTVALSHAEKAVSLSDNNMWYQSLLAELYIAESDFEKAEKTYERIIKEHAQAADLNYDLSMVRYRKGDIAGAIEALDQLESKMGFSQEIFQQKMLLYQESGQMDKAVKDLEEAIIINPKDPLYYGMLAELYDKQGNKEKALEYYQKILEFDPENGLVQFSLYEHYMNIGEKEKARNAIMLGFEDELIEIDTKMSILLNYYDRSEVEPEMKEEAYLLCQKLIETYPDEAKAHAMYGDFLMRDQRFAEARSSFLEAVRLEPGKQVIWSQILAIDSQLQDYDSMSHDSELAIELFPASPSFYLLNGVANSQLGLYKKAAEVLEAGKEMVFDDDGMLSEFYSSLGDTYHHLGRHIDSDRAFDRALRISPENVFILNNYSYYLSLRGELLDKAQTMALKANEIQPGMASFEDTYGWVLYQAAKYEEARIWIEKALDHGGSESGTILEHYGDILFRLGNTTEALEQWRKAKTSGDHSDILDQKIEEGRIVE